MTPDRPIPNASVPDRPASTAALRNASAPKLPWHSALAYALLGELVELDVQSAPDPPALLQVLVQRGYAREPAAASVRRSFTLR